MQTFGFNYEKQMSNECYEYSEVILGETNDKRNETLTELLTWLNDNPNINCNCDIKNLLYFIRGAKFNIEKTKKKIESYYRMRAERVEWFTQRDPFLPEIDELLDLGVFLPLKVKDENNRQVVIIRVAAHDPKKHSQNNVFKVGKMILDLVLHMDETVSVYGITAIFDMQNVTGAHALQLNPTLVKRSVESWNNYPCRTKLLEFINAPIYVNVVLNIFRTFMTAKMKSRVLVTKGKPTCNVELPINLGGTGESYEQLTIYWKNIVQDNYQWYRDDEQYKSIIE